MLQYQKSKKFRGLNTASMINLRKHLRVWNFPNSLPNKSANSAVKSLFFLKRYFWAKVNHVHGGVPKILLNLHLVCLDLKFGTLRFFLELFIFSPTLVHSQFHKSWFICYEVLIFLRIFWPETRCVFARLYG